MCGIAGAVNVPNAAHVVQLMLQKLEHRGRDAAGIISLDTERTPPKMYEHKGFGLACEVFRQVDTARDFIGMMAIGHVRYATTGESTQAANIQPLRGHIAEQFHALAHNGNITNAVELRETLTRSGAVLTTTSDTELILHLMARENKNAKPHIRLLQASSHAQGAYTLLLLTPEGISATIDPYGFRPLVICRYKGGYLIASEECAFRPFPEATDIRHLLRNRSWFWNTAGIMSEQVHATQPQYGRACSFETLYFSAPESELPLGKSVQTYRNYLGRILANKEQHILSPDLVTAVPDSSNEMARSYAAQLHVPFQFALIRSHSTGRTFTRAEQPDRELSVRMKFSVVRDIVRDKRITVVDDSIVRGTTMQRVIRLLRQAGAKEVHVRIGSPRVIHPCFWGINTPNFHELIAHKKSLEEITRYIGADTLEYLTLDDFLIALQDSYNARHCSTCFSGISPLSQQLIPPEQLLRAHTPV